MNNLHQHWSVSLPPTREAALSRAAAVRAEQYAKTRNHIDGAVTGLSPYVTHGLVTLSEVLKVFLEKESLTIGHKLVYELGWREFFRHVWAHEGNGIFESLHTGPLDDSHYKKELPADIRHAHTGVPVIDESIRLLYSTGGLHNHARMWLASYVVHIRKIHWRVGADWMVAHLLDGDLASNHLSWQWVAGTASHKPYLFNADNVARYAPSHWHSHESVIDVSYEELDRIARTARSADFIHINSDDSFSSVTHEPRVCSQPPDDLSWIDPGAAEAELIRDREVWLVHPWAVRQPPSEISKNSLVIGIYLRDHHDMWPWSESRWRWVDAAMSQITPHRWLMRADELLAILKTARSVRTVDDPHVSHVLNKLAVCDSTPMLFSLIERRCSSFSQWWNRTTKGIIQAHELL